MPFAQLILMAGKQLRRKKNACCFWICAILAAEILRKVPYQPKCEATRYKRHELVYPTQLNKCLVSIEPAKIIDAS